MDSVLQKKIIPLFHHTLNPGGILFLGTSESIGEHRDFFQPINRKWKIFERKKGFLETIPAYSPDVDYFTRQRTESNDNPPTACAIREMAERGILDAYAPAGVLINDQYEILHFVGKTERFLAPPPGKPSFNILNMAREDLKPPLMTVLQKAVREKTNTSLKSVRIKNKDALCIVDLSVKQMRPGFMLVIFEDKTPEKAGDKGVPGPLKTKSLDTDLQSLEHELQTTREYLQATIEELETSNEELKSTNEELQPTNEELTTVNAELQDKVDDYSNAGDDMQNLLAATEIASIFLDTDLCIKRYTPAAASLINLVPTDIGRSLNDLKTLFPDVDLVGLGEKVLKDLNTVELEILSKDLTWYAMKIMPYRTTRNIIAGVVMTFVDIHGIKQADKIRRLAAVLEDANDAITVLDLKGRILSWNKGAHELYGWTESEALQRNFSALVPKDREKELEEIVDKLRKNKTIKSFKTQRITKDGNILDIWLTASALTDENGRVVEIAITERDLAWLGERVED